MHGTFEAFVLSWPWAPWLVLSLAVTGIVYTRGWRQLHRRDPDRWSFGRLAMFLGGLASLFLALASPIESFASLLFGVHMLQHLLLMVVAPPLIWLGWPLLPMLRGLPVEVRTYWAVPILRWRPLRRLTRLLTHPFVAWGLFVATTWLWHTPRGYELALSSDLWHIVEHVCFFATSMLFWYPVVQPYPARRQRAGWLVFPYLLLADIQNTLLAAWLTFSPTVLYPHYERVPRIGGVSALEDQRMGGVLMWVPGSIAFLLPLFVLAVTYLRWGGIDERRRRRVWSPPADQSTSRVPTAGNASTRMQRVSGIRPAGVPAARAGRDVPHTRFDLLRFPVIGRVLRWRHLRTSLQILLAVLSGVVIYDGLTGPHVAPMNLAGVLPWIHWRGLLIFSLLVAGNVFCLACPFTIPRKLAGRWSSISRPWPRWLRSKWLAVGLMGLFLWSYEAFALWDRPGVTAWIAIGYFVAAFLVDSLFAEGSFCKYVCPIGQFNFVQSLMSPTEVAVREPSVCAGCTTHECLRGSPSVPGCQLQLFQPQKNGNMDCTFCLDCVHACPHENVGVLAVVPGHSLWNRSPRMTSRRSGPPGDLAALLLLLVFGAFANAAGMIAPVVRGLDAVGDRLGGLSPLLMTTGFYVLSLVIVPLLSVGAAAVIGRWWSGSSESIVSLARWSVPALVPIGFGMWLAHYSYHLFASWDVIIPSVQRFAMDQGLAVLGEPRWQYACCRPAANWVVQAQILMLDCGLLASLYAGLRIAEARCGRTGVALRSFLPWALLVVMLFALGVWIVLQPMEMRGTLPAV